jgi:signal transduction histidine kinase
VEYSPERGFVDIEWGMDNGRFRLAVANLCEDIEEEELPRLFERFWRRDGARSGSGHAGLGLSLAESCATVLALDLSVELKKQPASIIFTVSGPLDG